MPEATTTRGRAGAPPMKRGVFVLRQQPEQDASEIKACRQLRRECGDQKVCAAEVGLVHGLGGQFSSAATAVLARAR